MDGNLSVSTISQKSDKRIKENFKELDENDDIIDKVKVYSFNFINDESHLKHVGVIAQEVKEFAPELVRSDDNGVLSVNYVELIPYLINKVHQQDKIISQLMMKVNDNGV